MAKMERIPILGRMRGKVGDLIVKRYRDKYVVTAMPTPPDKRSEKQRAQSERFADAMDYAMEATRESPTRELYDEAVKDLDRASNTVAVSDFMRAPKIDRVDLGDYAGQKGARLTIRVENVVAVRRVAVFVLPPDDAADTVGDDDVDADRTEGTGDATEDAAAGDPEDAANTDTTKGTRIIHVGPPRDLHERALELGLASPTGDGGGEGEWSYTTKTDMETGGEKEPGLTVVIRVEDHPGNVVEERVAVGVTLS